MKGIESHARRIARELGLNTDNDFLPRITSYAIKEVKFLTDSFNDITTLGHLLKIVADRLRVELVFLHSENEIEELAERYGKGLKLRLRQDLVEGDTEGLLLQPPKGLSSGYKYLSVVDARGSRTYRAYFSAWHELTHVIVTPHRLSNEVRRTPPREKRHQDPEEWIVDHVASRLAFHRPIFRPNLLEEIKHERGLNFDAIRRAARESVGNEIGCPPSLYASAIAGIRSVQVPACFLTIDKGLKKKEKRRVNSPQKEIPGLEAPKPSPKLRIQALFANQAAKETIDIRRNMRIPQDSVLRNAYEHEAVPDDLTRRENQNQWETSNTGALPPLPLTVHATRRGSHTYGLLVANGETDIGNRA